ncbi:MAG: N-acetyltransferase [Clostridiales bacterium]|nr:N-acetyltransferase [Clostridiales bacterium]
MVRRATESDLPRALAIYDSARRFMRANGNTVQWLNGYPSEVLLRQDTARGDLYVMEDGGVIYGVFAFIIGDDPTYQTIHGACRRCPAGAACRRAYRCPATRRGVLAEAVDWALTRLPHLRADTHEANVTMQRCLERAGFVRCGVIHVADGTPRLAYERI